MPTETLEAAETVKTPEYTHKSFELVFANFCNQYKQKAEEVAGPKAHMKDRFLGMPGNVSVQEMGQKLAEVRQAIGEPPQWDEDHDEVFMKEAIVLSARHLAWSAVMAGITTRYLNKTNDYINKERHNGRNNLQRLFNERRAGVSLQIAYNHAIRDYFDSGLAQTLGNDSPQGMNNLLEHASFISDQEKSRLIRGIALEIAAKKDLEAKSDGKYRVAYGSPEQDADGGDLVIIGQEDIVFIDLKSKMPEKFPGEIASTELDAERGYKWLESTGEGRNVVVWAYSNTPVRPDKFTLDDGRLAANLQAVAATVTLDKASV
jgi:hypothetical protein